MLNNNKKLVIYRAFGFKVASDIHFPELQQVLYEDGMTDIEIRTRDLSERWSELTEAKKYFDIEPNYTVFQIPNIAIFEIINGKKIFFTPFEGIHEDQIRIYLLGTCMGVLLMQRRILPLHGSAIAIDGKAYAIVGDSGAGKSTTASALLKHGYDLISDDVIPVTLSSDNIPMVTPAYPQQKLWQESLDAFGMENNNFRPIVDRETKFAIPVFSQFTNKTLPLAGIFELVKTEGQNVEVHSIRKLERIHTLLYHTYRNFILQPAGLMEWHFNFSAKMLNKIELYQLKRPVSRFTANDLTEVILSTINKEVKVG